MPTMGNVGFRVWAESADVEPGFPELDLRGVMERPAFNQYEGTGEDEPELIARIISLREGAGGGSGPRANIAEKPENQMADIDTSER